jgi:ketosteroid isomerase-like protein
VSERNIAATKAIYEAVPKGDAAAVFANIDPEIHVIYYGDEHIPYAGEYKGLDGITDFLIRVAGAVTVEKMEPKLFIPDGDNLAVWGHQWFKANKSGRQFDTDFAHIISLRDGKWLFFRDFANSATASEVFRSEEG